MIYSSKAFHINVSIFLGDFCGKREWWFHGVGNKTRPMEPDFDQKMEVLFYFDYDYCPVDMMKSFSDPKNSE